MYLVYKEHFLKHQMFTYPYTLLIHFQPSKREQPPYKGQNG